MSLPDTARKLIESCRKEHPCDLEIRYNEPMSAHSTFRTGGPADCWLKPAGGPIRADEAASDSGGGFQSFAVLLLAAARAERIPVFFLGGGANILVADKGIRGIVLDTGGWAGETGLHFAGRQEGMVRFRCGTKLDDAAEAAADAGLCGLEFLAGMPGSIGGAVWMNARCYGKEIADVLAETEIIDFSVSPSQRLTLPANRAEFGYKLSPFQKMDAFILSASFRLTPGDAPQIRAEMESHRKDREAKGHYRYPSAGSVFKNNTAFGKPTGQIIDELGLRGMQKGGAQVAPWHGNIIVNAGGACSADIRSLVDEVAAAVHVAAGFSLEPEILFIGEW